MALDAITALILVTVVEGTVKEPVASLGGAVDGIGSVISDLSAFIAVCKSVRVSL